MRRLATVAFVLVAGTVLAGAPKPMPAAKYSIRVEVVDKSGTTFVPIAEVSRAGDKVTTKALAAPAIDKLADELEQRWNAFKPPASLTVTEHLASDTGMNPQYRPYSATFTTKDGLYQAAVVKTFVEKYGYVMLGLSGVHYIIHDASAEFPPGADNRASTHSNFRKNPGGIQYDGKGHDSVFLSVRVRPSRRRAPPTSACRGPTRRSRLAIHTTRARCRSDGSISCRMARSRSTRNVPRPAVRRLVQVPTRGHRRASDQGDESKYLKVEKASPWNLEAQLVNQWEARSHYDIAPVIDPVVFR